MELTVTDHPDEGLYALTDATSGDRVGLAAYRRTGTTWTFTHTEVDHVEGAHGLGGTLVRGALDDVRAQGGTVVPLCTFVRGWIERHAEYADLVARD